MESIEEVFWTKFSVYPTINISLLDLSAEKHHTENILISIDGKPYLCFSKRFWNTGDFVIAYPYAILHRLLFDQTVSANDTSCDRYLNPEREYYQENPFILCP